MPSSRSYLLLPRDAAVHAKINDAGDGEQESPLEPARPDAAPSVHG
jgi:hypothetical protein